MDLIKLNSKGSFVRQLQVMLNLAGYQLHEDGHFGKNVQNAVMDFQSRNELTPDGKVGVNTWTKLEKLVSPQLQNQTDKSLKSSDIDNAATKLKVEPEAIQAVVKVESSGNGFLSDNRPTILFEGHIFWGRIKKTGLMPEKFVAGHQDVLYPKWVKTHYKGGKGEYDRLTKAENIEGLPDARILALQSASWGLFQIMGFHAKSLGYSDVVQFVEANYRSEGEQLDAFVRFIEVNKLDEFLRKKDWAGFAYRYNGAQYKLNKYDEKLAKAYSNAIGASRDIDFTAEKFKINHIGRPFGIDKEWF